MGRWSCLCWSKSLACSNGGDAGSAEAGIGGKSCSLTGGGVGIRRAIGDWILTVELRGSSQSVRIMPGSHSIFSPERSTLCCWRFLVKGDGSKPGLSSILRFSPCTCPLSTMLSCKASCRISHTPNSPEANITILLLRLYALVCSTDKCMLSVQQPNKMYVCM